MTQYVDFNRVEDKHLDIHRRLNNWSSWVRVRPQSGWTSSIIWRQVRSNAWQWHPPEYRETCDMLDAQALEKAVAHLPAPHRDALRWCYVYGGSPARMAAHLGLSKDGLALMVRDGRQMLCNRIGL